MKQQYWNTLLQVNTSMKLLKTLNSGFGKLTTGVNRDGKEIMSGEHADYYSIFFSYTIFNQLPTIFKG